MFQLNLQIFEAHESPWRMLNYSKIVIGKSYQVQLDILGHNAQFNVQMLGPGDSGLPGNLLYASVLLLQIVIIS